MDKKGTESAPIKPKRRKIVKEDVAAVCKLVAKGLTERESLAKLDIKEASWHKWKQRHQSQFDSTFSKIKANRIANLLDRMERHSEGDADSGIKADWRCTHALLPLADARFREKQPESVQATPVLAIVASSVVEQIFGRLTCQDAPKALPDANVPAKPAIVDVVAEPVKPA